MVKKKVGGGKRYKAVQAAQKQNKAPEWDGPAPPSHMQRKITRKVQFLEKVAAAKASQPAKVGAAGGVSKKSKKKAKPLPSLADLAGTLEDVLAGKQASTEKQQQQQHTFGQSVGTLKARTLIMNKESARLHQVLNHPQFKADPIAAITNHIQATMPPAPAKPQPSSQQKKKKKKKKQQGGSTGMEME